MKVVVLGGAGTLGRALVASLRTRGLDPQPASRRTGVDLVSGKGLADALGGSDVVVHAVSNPARAGRVDLPGTRTLIETVSRSPAPPHLVYVSIVGCSVNPYPYYRVKHACERLLEETDGLPVTVVRATQFHPLVAAVARAARPLGLGVTIRGLCVQPCDVSWVAEQLSGIATSRPPTGFTRHPDLAGPERFALAEGIARMASHDHVRLRRTITLPDVGAAARAFSAGTNLAGPAAEVGGQSFMAWLAGQPPRPERHAATSDPLSGPP